MGDVYSTFLLRFFGDPVGEKEKRELAFVYQEWKRRNWRHVGSNRSDSFCGSRCWRRIGQRQ